MPHDDHEVLSALLDREPVHPDTLATVLEEAAGRALLVDFVRLRHVLHADGYAGSTEDAARSIQSPGWGPGVRRAAAALLLITAGGLGGMWLTRDERDSPPPEPSRIVKLEPVSAPAGGGGR
jgi:hypothetical protein